MPLTEKALMELESIVGSENFSADKPTCLTYCSLMHGVSYFPAKYIFDAVVRPASTEEVQKIVLLANREKIPLYPRGLGYSQMHFPGPDGGVCVDLGRMNRIISVDEDSRFVVMEAGVTVGQLLEYFAKHHPRFEPIIPNSAPLASTMGGFQVGRTGGPYQIRAGTGVDSILSFEGVLPNGEIVQTGAASMNQPWFLKGDWQAVTDPRFMLAALGTMGIITKFSSRMFPKPQVREERWYGFDSMEDVVDPLTQWMYHQFGLESCYGGNWVGLASGFHGLRHPFPDPKKAGWPNAWAVLLYGGHPEEVALKKRLVEDINKKSQKKGNSIRPMRSPMTPYGDRLTEREMPWTEVQRWVHQGNLRYVPTNTQIWFISYVMARNIPAFLHAEDEITEKYGFYTNFHFRAYDWGRMYQLKLTLTYDISEDKDVDMLREALREFALRVKNLGVPVGPQSPVVIPYLIAEFPSFAKQVKLYLQLKDMMDPNNIMNPQAVAPMREAMKGAKV